MSQEEALLNIEIEEHVTKKDQAVPALKDYSFPVTAWQGPIMGGFDNGSRREKANMCTTGFHLNKMNVPWAFKIPQLTHIWRKGNAKKWETKA